VNMTHEQVHHRQFGVGMITGQTMTTVTVEFCEKYGIKKFLYPSSFESFLELCDPVSKGRMDDELRQLREQAEETRRQRAEEDEKRRTEEQRVLSEQKRAAVKKRSPAGKAPKKLRKQRDEDEELAEEAADI